VQPRETEHGGDRIDLSRSQRSDLGHSAQTALMVSWCHAVTELASGRI
jgi:hypothetical protein